LRVGDRGGSGGIGGRVASNGWRLFLLALMTQAALGEEMHAPCHVMFTPVVRVLAHFLGLLVTVLGSDLLPSFVLLLPGLVTPVLLVPHLLGVIVEGIFKGLVGLEMFFEGIDLGGHGNNLLVIGRFGTPLPLHPEPIILAQGRGHEGLVSEIDELAVKVVIIEAPDVRLEVVAGDGMIGFKQEPDTTSL